MQNLKILTAFSPSFRRRTVLTSCEPEGRATAYGTPGNNDRTGSTGSQSGGPASPQGPSGPPTEKRRLALALKEKCEGSGNSHDRDVWVSLRIVVGTALSRMRNQPSGAAYD